MPSITVTVNGTSYTNDVEPRLLLVHYLRDVLGLTGTHVGCDTSQCGACTIQVDGRAIKSCTLFAVQADGADMLTIEGMAQGDELHPIQEGFWEEHGLQCGFCTPRHDHDRPPNIAAHTTAHRGGNPPRLGGQPVSLHWLP